MSNTMNTTQTTIRSDDRDDYSIRPLTLQVNHIHEADGSAKLNIGNTIVSCSVYGPLQSKIMRKEHPKQLTIEVDYKSPELVGGSIGASNTNDIRKERLLSGYVEQVLESMIDLTLFPRLVLQVNVSVVNDDGSSLTAAINCAILAILNAGIPMLCTPAAVTIGLLQNNDSKRLILDPTYAEERNSCAVFSFAFGNHVYSREESLLRARDVQESLIREDGSDIVVSLAVGNGQFTRDEFTASLDLGRTASTAILNVMRQAIEN